MVSSRSKNRKAAHFAGVYRWQGNKLFYTVAWSRLLSKNVKVGKYVEARHAAAAYDAARVMKGLKPCNCTADAYVCAMESFFQSRKLETIGSMIDGGFDETRDVLVKLADEYIVPKAKVTEPPAKTAPPGGGMQTELSDEDFATMCKLFVF